MESWYKREFHQLWNTLASEQDSQIALAYNRIITIYMLVWGVHIKYLVILGCLWNIMYVNLFPIMGMSLNHQQQAFRYFRWVQRGAGGACHNIYIFIHLFLYFTTGTRQIWITIQMSETPPEAFRSIILSHISHCQIRCLNCLANRLLNRVYSEYPQWVNSRCLRRSPQNHQRPLGGAFAFQNKARCLAVRLFFPMQHLANVTTLCQWLPYN
jgi:hypothetical protein